MYEPAEEMDYDLEEEDDSSDASLEQGKTSKKKRAKKEKVRIPISQEFLWIYSQVVGCQRASYVQKFKPIARS